MKLQLFRYFSFRFSLSTWISLPSNLIFAETFAQPMTSLPIGSDGIPVHWTIKNYDGD